MNMNIFFKSAAPIVTSAVLIACGGGGGSGTSSGTQTPNPAPLPIASSLPVQGIWRSAAGAVPAVSALVTDNGQTWVVLTDSGSTRLVKASLTASGAGFTGTGKGFDLGTTTVLPITLSATAVAKTSLSGNISSAGQSEPYSLAYQTSYDTPAALTDFAGTRSASLGPGTVTWSINNNGALTGTRTTGCSYTGQVTLRPEASAVVDVAVTESCPAVTQLSGVAVKSADSAGITMLLTTANDAQGVLLSLR